MSGLRCSICNAGPLTDSGSNFRQDGTVLCQSCFENNPVEHSSACNEPHFWMLYRENGGYPRHVHLSYQEALMEAHRILRKEGGPRVFILEATQIVEIADFKVTDMKK